MRVKPVTPRLRRAHPLARGLSAFWALSDGGGLTLVEQRTRGDAQLDLAGIWEGSPFGLTLVLDGSQIATSSLQLGQIISQTEGTLAAVFRIDDHGPGIAPDTGYNGDGIIGDANGVAGLSVGLDSSDSSIPKIFAHGYNSSGVSVRHPYTIGEWYHAAWVMGGGTLSLYINGVSVGSVTLAQVATLNYTVYLGRNYNNSARFNGAIAGVAAWNRALSADEAQAISQDFFAPIRPPELTPALMLAATPAVAAWTPRAIWW